MSSRVKRNSFVVALAGLTVLSGATTPALAQRYFLKNGSVLGATEVTVSASALVQTVQLPSGETYERRFPFSEVVRLDFPVPPALDEAAPLVATGQAAAALALLDPIHREWAGFAATPGSPWPRAAALRLQALLLRDDSAAVTVAARELILTGLGPEVTGLAALALTEIDVRAGQTELAHLMLEEILKNASPAVEARAWLLRGDLALARAAHTEALECYLRIPAFFSTFDELMPDALLGAARAYRGYGDADRAERAALELADIYPTSRQAAAAKKEFNL
ncbi:MAG: hypothetical protein EAZ36_04875 [Verrucomicrobia bacterium]|nr:MAG: hypothetical protein EAZ36_04875 [Verrucomicrobiota bacterium]